MSLRRRLMVYLLICAPLVWLMIIAGFVSLLLGYLAFADYLVHRDAA